MYKSALSTFLGNFTFLSTFKSTFFQLFRTQNLYGLLAMMMMVILVFDGELMDVIQMMVDKQANLAVDLEVDEVTEEI